MESSSENDFGSVLGDETCTGGKVGTQSDMPLQKRRDLQLPLLWFAQCMRFSVYHILTVLYCYSIADRVGRQIVERMRRYMYQCTRIALLKCTEPTSDIDLPMHYSTVLDMVVVF